MPETSDWAWLLLQTLAGRQQLVVRSTGPKRCHLCDAVTKRPLVANKTVVISLKTKRVEIFGTESIRRRATTKGGTPPLIALLLN